jgi:outer membrane protein OmpA-like peptidoglycan-associated protein
MVIAAMLGEQKQSWLTSAVAAALATAVVIATAGFAAVKWGMPHARHYLDARIAAVNSKLDKNNAALAQAIADDNVALTAKLTKANNEALAAIKKLPSLEGATKALQGTASEIETLNGKIKKTNDALSDIQKQASLSSIKAGLAPLDGKLDKATAALAAIQTDLAHAGDARSADQTARDAALGRIENAVGAVKDTLAANKEQLAANAAQLTAVKDQLSANKKQIATNDGQLADNATQAGLKDAATKLDAVQTSLAKIQQTAEALSARVSANAAALDETHKALAGLQAAVKNGFAGASSARTELKDTVAALKQAPAAASAPKKVADDLVVFYVSPSAAARARQTAAAPAAGVAPPMSVQFEKIGGLDDNGQAATIAKKLRAILKGRKGCTVAVAGHADTVGSDDVNHDLSQRRANEVAKKLKAAFAGEQVKITETAWGERKLQEWTPDETPDVTNRRVDIAVHCEGG